MEKASIRRSLLKQRQSMSVLEWQEKSTRICTHLQSSPLFKQAKTILAYFSTRQEPDLNSLFNSKHRWGFPRCISKSLYWHLWQPGDILLSGAYGISEPTPAATTIAPNEVDLILVPAVGCDYQGYRLGYGGGFYDRMLSDSQWALKPTIGIVFAFAYLEQLPIDNWDKRLSGVCTEDGLFFPVKNLSK